MDSFEPLADSALGPMTSPALDPLFWRPNRLGVVSAWYGHVPFAQWLMAAARPDCFVELGSHAGVSYSAFCDTVLRRQLATRCFAVDTWQGDEHAGFYGEDIFADLSAFHDRHYGGFSRMLRLTFDEALGYFPDNSIDLLHIDGRHHYDDVAHDYRTWAPKLSSRAIVLFHDTNVRERDFGVWRLWQELSAQYPHFEFFHAHGLGVLLHGAEPPELLREFCAYADPPRLRERFCLLGERWEQDFARTQREWRITELQRVAQRHFNELRQKTESFHAEKSKLFQQTAQLQSETELSLGELAHARAQIALLEGERDVILNSTSWRLMAKLMRLSSRIPAPARRAARSAIRVVRGRAQPAPPPAADAAMASPIAASPGAQSHAQHSASPAAEAQAPAIVPRAGAARSGRILFISGEPETPGHNYRVLRAARSAAALGWQAETLLVPEATDARLTDARLVVIWRACWSPEVEHILIFCTQAGIPTIFDVDDLMFRPELARTEIIDAIRTLRLSEFDVQRFYVRVNRVMLAADMASATTAELAAQLRLSKKPAFVVPNCWDQESWWRARLAVRRRTREKPDGLIRLGYAGGTRTHQKDVLQAVGAVARILRAFPDCRLVLFRDPRSGEGLVLPQEFPDLADVGGQIEWRDMVPLDDLPAEIARFDINLAPLETGNIFVEAKSELKYWEAALAGVPTIASPTGPYRRAIDHGRTGYLAETPDQWAEYLTALVQDPALRARIARDAYIDSLWRFGPLAHEDAVGAMIDQALGGRPAARAVQLDLLTRKRGHKQPILPDREILRVRDALGRADVTVIVPVYNYAHYVTEALDSVAAQTMAALDLVVVDDCSTDESRSTVMRWLDAQESRFNRVVFARHTQNAGLGFSRNTGFDLAETPYVLPLDADNTLRPGAATRLAECLAVTGAAFAYPTIQRFGKDQELVGQENFLAARFIAGNYIDAMALIRRDAWAAAGGYDHVRFGWEDYDFWCRLVERGLWGEHVDEILADYRAHEHSMLHTSTDLRENKVALIEDMMARHDWLELQYMVE